MSLLSLIWAYPQPPFHDLSFIVPKESGSFSRDSSALGWQLPSGFRAKPTYRFVSLSIHLIWGAAVLLLVVAVVLFAVFARRKGMKLSTSSSGSVWKRRAGDRVCFPHEKSFRSLEKSPLLELQWLGGRAGKGSGLVQPGGGTVK